MTLDNFLVGLLVDPVDYGELLYVESNDLLYNARRRVAYPVRDGIAVLLADEARSVDDDEHEALVHDPSGRPTGSR